MNRLSIQMKNQVLILYLNLIVLDLHYHNLAKFILQYSFLEFTIISLLIRRVEQVPLPTLPVGAVKIHVEFVLFILPVLVPIPIPNNCLKNYKYRKFNIKITLLFVQKSSKHDF